MEVYASTSWRINLSDDEAFRITGQGYPSSPVRTIEVSSVKFHGYFGGMLELSGAVVKKDGNLGIQSGRVEVSLDDDRIPRRVLDEVNRMRRLRERFIADAKGTLS